MDATLIFDVNGKKRMVTTDPDRPLLDVLREELQLTGPKYGCGEGHCGACGVLVDGKRIFSCITSASDAQGKAVTTIEGMCNGDVLHPVQQAFLEEGAFQCGYCTPGMIVAAAALLSEKPKPSDADIRSGMNRNVCRCCSHTRIVNAVKRAAAHAEVRP
jgi:aerobic-type carbon monoxide dehydrogenase small subunit (CoxS/CutS family)